MMIFPNCTGRYIISNYWYISWVQENNTARGVFSRVFIWLEVKKSNTMVVLNFNQAGFVSSDANVHKVPYRGSVSNFLQKKCYISKPGIKIIKA
jgi:hypothetical protein